MRHPTLLTLALGVRKRRSPLSASEIRVLEGLARGWTTGEVACRSGLPHGQVTGLVLEARRKLRATSATQAVANALALGLLFRSP
ncbi:hypothetical protein [Kitasatospora sp. HPMI-4]|uniref:hypothetical protein n=1 Tax=Kitasatospora sp. HPMI-4 TaxID=3448443 RepID=UPI003F1B64EC